MTHSAMKLYPWHQQVLQIVIQGGGLTAQQVGDLWAPTEDAFQRARVALHELLELLDMNLVQRSVGKSTADELWSPALMAAEALATSRRASAHA